jgi:hypothetical protein
VRHSDVVYIGVLRLGVFTIAFLSCAYWVMVERLGTGSVRLSCSLLPVFCVRFRERAAEDTRSILKSSVYEYTASSLSGAHLSTAYL